LAWEIAACMVLEPFSSRYHIVAKMTELFNAVFGHHATSDSGRFGQAADRSKVCRDGHHGKNQRYNPNVNSHQILLSLGVMSDKDLGDSRKLQQVRNVTTQIREEMKPLTRLDGMS